jgi:hypothetical protein
MDNKSFTTLSVEVIVFINYSSRAFQQLGSYSQNKNLRNCYDNNFDLTAELLQESSFCLSFFLCGCMYFYLSVFLPICMYVFLSFCLYVWLSIFLLVYLHIFHSVCLPTNLSVCPSALLLIIYLSVFCCKTSSCFKSILRLS